MYSCIVIRFGWPSIIKALRYKISFDKLPGSVALVETVLLFTKLIALITTSPPSFVRASSVSPCYQFFTKRFGKLLTVSLYSSQIFNSPRISFSLIVYAR